MVKVKFTTQAAFFIALITILLSANFSCRKMDIQAPVPVENIPPSRSNDISRIFFNTHLPSDEKVIAVRNNILRQEQKTPFIDKFVNYAGYPVWDKAITKTGTENSGLSRNTTGEQKGEVIFIPIASGNDSIIKSILRVNIIGNDTSFKMIYRWQYKENGYKKNSKFNNADQTALLFMGLESYTFGHNDFKINDTLLFRKNDTSAKQIHIVSFNKSAVNQMAQYVTISICYERKIDVYNADCPPPGGGVLPTETVCVDYNILVETGDAGGGGGGNGGTSPAPPPGGGGGGGGNGGWQDDPCAPRPPAGPVARAPLPCDGGGDPWSPAPLPNGNTLTPPTQQQIEAAIKNRPFALFTDVPCETIRKWLAIATFQPSSAIISKLQSVYSTTTYPPGTGSIFPAVTIKDISRVQNINDAFSSVVNMDYFSVKVNTLPVVNGIRLTADQFLHYIRTNINSFVNTNISKFTPYKYGSTDDDVLWNSSSPTGAIVSIAIPGNYGSVITSFSTNNKWTFTTIHDPLNGDHPVSGNRDFGYTANPDGSYTFYTQGVDRLTDWEMDLAQKQPIEMLKPLYNTDQLWKSFQTGIFNFLNTHSGTSVIQSPVIYYPNWQTVWDVVVGKKPLSTLSKFCPE